MEHNGYHDFLYIWKPKEFKLFEVSVDNNRTYINQTFLIPEDGRNGKLGPNLLVLLDQLYCFPDIVEEFEKHSEYYFFCCNYNYYLKDIDISSLFPEIKDVYIFSIEVLWKKYFPDHNSLHDYIINNEKNTLCYDNLENVNEFAKNHSNLKITYLICETGIEKLSQDRLKSYKFKIKNFNFYILINLLITSRMLKDPIFCQSSKLKLPRLTKSKKLNNPKILNLNRRPDVHRFFLTNSLLGQFHNNPEFLKISWLGVSTYNQLYLSAGDSKYSKEKEKTFFLIIKEKFLENLNQEETSDMLLGEDLLKKNKYYLDKDLFKNDGFFRFADTFNHYDDVFLEIVSESIFFGPLGDVSEKSIRPIATKTPFLILGGPESFKILENLGFQSYNNLLDINDHETNSVTRLRSILKFTKDLSKLSSNSFKEYGQNLYKKSASIIDHNYNMLTSDQLLKNIKSWILTIYQ